MYRISIALAALILCLSAVAAVTEEIRPGSPGVHDTLSGAESTFERFLLLADAGDPDAQNLIGFLYFQGEGVQQNFEKAHDYFHRAAEQGDLRAQRNLGIFHSKGVREVPTSFNDAKEANFWFSVAIAGDPTSSAQKKAVAHLEDLGSVLDELIPTETNQQQLGARVYYSFCAGCHGFDGMAAYGIAPSFALGEELEKNDEELLASIVSGRGVIPAWGASLSEDLSRSALAFIREGFEAPTPALPRAYARFAPTDVASSSELELGKNLFLTFCGGCHGFNGIAYYVKSPSFVLGERMNLPAGELERSIREGKGIMPGWGSKLSDREIRSLVAFIQTLEPSYELGIESEPHEIPNLYFRFRPLGEYGKEWMGADPLGVEPNVLD